MENTSGLYDLLIHHRPFIITNTLTVSYYLQWLMLTIALNISMLERTEGQMIALFSKQSQLNIALENNLLNWPLDGVCVGDDAFPLRHNLLTPFSHRNLTLEERIFNYRLSRARRVSENAFGILVSRFRVFTHSISLAVDTTEFVVKAACALHNWLRKTSAKSYLPPGSLDYEDLNTGEIVPGSWRAEVIPLVNAETLYSNKNYKMEVKRIRNRYAKAFVNENAVPWQLKSINWKL